ncbi:prefoldin subunit 1-like [Sycon ciliatum]|uniref:prefoldin subunit 1-like n=1 Tax=Sycon ciliatum TaxID=27933 RepID=UPI0020ABC03D|eukprot:scpid2038/ scgid27207/ Prefoldin subunit 1
MADAELKRAFAELQQKMVETEQRMRMADAQIDGLKRSVKRTILTKQEISGLPEGTRTYDSVGRCFILRPADDISKMLDDRVKTSEERIKTLDEQKGYMEKNVKESQESLRELVRQKQSRA